MKTVENKALMRIYRKMLTVPALMVSSYFREQVGNLDIMPKDCFGKNREQLIQLISNTASVEKSRIDASIDADKVIAATNDAISIIEKSLTEDSDEWKKLIPGKQLLNMFASKANINTGRLKLLYLKESEKTTSSSFDDILKIFSEFNSH